MLNNVNVQGRLVYTPELRRTPQDVAVTSFKLAIDRDRVNKDGVRESDFVDVTAWRGLAEFAVNEFVQGDTIVVSGRIQTHRYEGADGATRNVLEIVADNIYFPGFMARREDAGEPGSEPVYASEVG